MPDLETLLRDVRPAPDPDWATRLDARVAARFPGPPPRWKAPLIAFREHLLAFGAVGAVASLLIVAVVVGIGSSGGTADLLTSGSNDEGGSGGAGTAEPASGGNKSGGAIQPLAQVPEPSSDSAAGVTREARGRAVQRNASITLSTRPDRVDDVADRAIRAVDGLGGFVQSSEVNSGSGDASATLALRIPSSRFDRGMAQLSRLAHVKQRSQGAEDLTDQRSALEASVRDARADRTGLRARLAKAATDRERSRLRALLDRASRRVTQRERQVAELNRQVAYATVDLSIEGDRRSGAAAPVAGRWTPGDALGDAVRVLEVIAGVLVIGLAVVAPVAILALLAALMSRVVVRRRRERALEMA